MHQSPQKQMPRHRDRRDELDALEEEAERRAWRSAPPKARKFHLQEEAPRRDRSERGRPQS